MAITTRITKDVNMADVDSRLEKIETKLDAIHTTLAQMAIQGEQILTLRQQQETLWRKYDKLVETVHLLQVEDIAQIESWQSSCPRHTVKWLWIVVIPMGVALLGVAVALFKS